MADINLSAHPFIGGILIGLVLALPTGPGAFMVIKQGIGRRMSVVLKAALVCMVVDLLWNIALCAFGSVSLTIVDYINDHKEMLRAGAGPILMCVGAYAYRSMRITNPDSGLSETLFAALFNPLIPVTLIALITYVVGGAHFTNSKLNQIQVIAGIFVGEVVMWLLGIKFFHLLMLKGLPEKGIPLFFIALFTVTGAYLTIMGIMGKLS